MAAELPTCECVGGMPPYDRLTAIYQAAAELSGDSSLPDALCVAGVPPFKRFGYIYAAFRTLAGDDSLPSQECVEGESFIDQVARIYQAALIYAGDSSLPTYECVRGLPLWSIWLEVYRALYSAAGSPEELEDPLCVNVAGLDVLSQVFCALLVQDTPPQLVSAEILLGGTDLVLTFDEDIIGSLGFTLNENGGGVAITHQITVGNQIFFGIDTPADPELVYTLDYAPGDVQDLDGNPLGAFVNFPVENNTAQFTFLRPGGVDTYFRPDGTSIYLRP